jgi:hypothetical protein
MAKSPNTYPNLIEPPTDPEMPEVRFDVNEGTFVVPPEAAGVIETAFKTHERQTGTPVHPPEINPDGSVGLEAGHLTPVINGLYMSWTIQRLMGSLENLETAAYMYKLGQSIGRAALLAHTEAVTNVWGQALHGTYPHLGTRVPSPSPTSKPPVV